MKLGCVILAAGQARRFGSNKLLTPLGGRPMLSYVLDMLPRDRFVKVMAVVSNPETERLCRECGIESLRYSGGPQSDSIRLGVGAMKEMDGCLFVMGDQPLCTGASVEKMLDAFVLDPGHVYRLSFGDTQASPVLFPKDTFDGLSKLTGERGAWPWPELTREESVRWRPEIRWNCGMPIHPRLWRRWNNICGECRR